MLRRTLFATTALIAQTGVVEAEGVGAAQLFLGVPFGSEDPA